MTSASNGKANGSSGLPASFSPGAARAQAPDFPLPTSSFSPESLNPFFSPPPKQWQLKPMISEHPAAPAFCGPDASLVLQQMLDEVLSGRFSANEHFMSMIKQTATVSLWFFLKVVAAYAGAYSAINAELHLEMANFRQLCLSPGGYFAAFTPRGSYKSTILNTGANPWEFIRNPDLTIGIFSATIDKAQEFYKQSKSIMDSNALFKDLWPELVPASIGRGSEWNDSSLCIANRRERKATPSMAAYTASGSVSGTHVGLANIDDIITDAMLNSVRSATSELIEKKNWFTGNIHSLREEVGSSRTIVEGTRYSIEDPYEDVQMDSRQQFGDWTVLGDRYRPRENGMWITYYRSAKVVIDDIEYSIQPKAYSLEFLKMLEERDPWAYHYQYENNAVGTAGSQLGSYVPGQCIFTDEGIIVTNTDEFVRYVECDITVSLDPAGRATRASSRTSQTAMVILCRDAKGRKFIDGRKGYVKTTQWFDWIFGRAEFFGEALGRTVVEEAAGFKSLDSVILAEQWRRQVPLKYRGVPSLGDKIATIQTIVQPQLEAGKLYFNEKCRVAFLDELKMFPNGSAMDLLDALKIALRLSRNPESESVVDENERFSKLSNSTAY